MSLPQDAEGRKDTPMARGLLDYFPDALAEVARVSKAGNDQHNPGQPLHWAKEKSTDHADCIIRHLVDRGKLDTDGQRHSAKVAWRALANLQIELDRESDDPERWPVVADPPEGYYQAEQALFEKRVDSFRDAARRARVQKIAELEYPNGVEDDEPRRGFDQYGGPE